MTSSPAPNNDERYHALKQLRALPKPLMTADANRFALGKHMKAEGICRPLLFSYTERGKFLHFLTCTWFLTSLIHAPYTCTYIQIYLYIPLTYIPLLLSLPQCNAVCCHKFYLIEGDACIYACPYAYISLPAIIIFALPYAYLQILLSSLLIYTCNTYIHTYIHAIHALLTCAFLSPFSHAFPGLCSTCPSPSTLTG